MLTNWSEGYVNDINYTTGYYDGLNSHQLICPFLIANLQPPKVINACELGFGFGVSLNIHAVAGTVKWYGTDFNPSHAFFAQQLANQGNPDKVVIADQSFAEFCHRDDLPDFDFITLHGIWSWISPQNRETIVDFIQRKLKVGGVVYISYNTLPGWAGKSPIRYLLNQYYSKLSATLESKDQAIKSALEHTKNMLSVSNSLLSLSPYLLEQVEQIKEQNSNYVIHEFTNQNWYPMYFSEIESCLKQAKLSYACSVSYLDDFDEVLFDEEQQKLLSSIQDPSLFQTAKDFILNKQFRRDYWVKGKSQLTNQQGEKEWKKLNILLVSSTTKISTTIKNYRQTEFKEELLKPIIEKLSDYKIHSLESLCEALKGDMPPNALFRIIALLVARKEVVITQSAETIEAATNSCQKFNRAILDNPFAFNNVNYLASPVSGGGIYYSNIELLFLSAYVQKIPEKQWEKYVRTILTAHNQLLRKDDNILSSEEEILGEISRLKKEFLDDRFEITKSLKVV
ncbi:class I SAM-dependent methyltransferase [Glaesserella parasuis]|uniref:class I SAM-dependent methyltransferase n=1 Tax=Glaesserella parasuis TaxID=738 RepID=UPI0024372025|nr:class I SAM-dependent methyltransferase [Glaesserella parasuis]MDG6465398.1 class I SAM-dependent methyltransferase [Glaesserella parasuis]MDO9979919.1 class I SAM-dependent methyltransferase [Glaesserella parasuis]MDO9990740.1 class I SAM-dependent methyltransferase [Glaesserella parasuis]MDP0001292.1 class I SAM-dependent methyltransferase [Glaesserella parasuis]